MGLNKFITKKGRVLLDLTEDTVTPETLAKGATAHDRSGEPIVGTMEGGGSPIPIEVATADEMNALLETAEVGAIYKYTGTTTDTYENGALYVVEEEAANLISFTIEGTSYQAEEGMTWLEWVNSKYNTASFICSGNDDTVNTNDSSKWIIGDGGTEYGRSTIRAGVSYTLYSSGGGGGTP